MVGKVVLRNLIEQIWNILITGFFGAETRTDFSTVKNVVGKLGKPFSFVWFSFLLRAISGWQRFPHQPLLTLLCLLPFKDDIGQAMRRKMRFLTIGFDDLFWFSP